MEQRTTAAAVFPRTPVGRKPTGTTGSPTRPLPSAGDERGAGGRRRVRRPFRGREPRDGGCPVTRLPPGRLAPRAAGGRRRAGSAGGRCRGPLGRVDRQRR